MPLRIQLKRFQPSQLSSILTIEQASFGLDAYPKELFWEYALDPDCFFLVAKVGRSHAGYAIARSDRHGGELISLAVRPRNRRQGVGKTLLSAVIRRFRRAGAAALRLMVHVNNPGAAIFYRQFGFRTTGRVENYYEDGGTAIRMRLALETRDKRQ